MAEANPTAVIGSIIQYSRENTAGAFWKIVQNAKAEIFEEMVEGGGWGSSRTL